MPGTCRHTGMLGAWLGGWKWLCPSPKYDVGETSNGEIEETKGDRHLPDHLPCPQKTDASSPLPWPLRCCSSTLWYDYPSSSNEPTFEGIVKVLLPEDNPQVVDGAGVELHTEDDVTGWAPELLVVALQLGGGESRAHRGKSGPREPPRLTGNPVRERSPTPNRSSELSGETSRRAESWRPVLPPGDKTASQEFPAYRSEWKK